MITSTVPDIVSTLRQVVERHADEIAIFNTEKSLDFQTFDELSNRVAAGLAAKGIKPGERVSLYCFNSDLFAICYFGIIKAGAIAVPLNLLLPVSDLVYILDNAAASGLIYHPIFSDQVRELRDEVVSLQHVFCLGEPPEAEVNDLQTILAQEQPLVDIPIDADDIASIIYTSGTTGRPKGAMLTHRNLVANVNSIAQALKLRPGRDRFFVVLPMFHSFAHTVGMLLPLLSGYCLVPCPKFDLDLVADTIARSGATIFMGVPTMYGLLLQLDDQQKDKLDTIRYCISGGAAMPLSIMQRFEERFGKLIYEGDGPTECGPVTSVNPIEGERKPGSVGLPIPDVEMTIRDAEGNTIVDGEIGEICVRSPAVMKGYWQNESETNKAFFGDWYRTGDLGYRDEEGYFYIVDRLKDMIIVNGMNVYPKMVEEVLYQYPGVKEAALVGVHDELHGEIPVAYLACESGGNVTEQDIVQFCNEKLARFQVPRHVYFMESLPKTPTGKILKRELRKQGERERGVVVT